MQVERVGNIATVRAWSLRLDRCGDVVQAITPGIYFCQVGRVRQFKQDAPSPSLRRERVAIKRALRLAFMGEEVYRSGY